MSVHPHIRGAYGLGELSPGPAAVHPHIRGAYNAAGMPVTNGSVHPHIRGAYGSILRIRPSPGRFIPTYVGHTFHSNPHSRHSLGSSPHTWGIRDQGTNFIGWFRFIPTYVGHTRGFCLICLSPSVHPHIRGAYVPSVRVLSVAPGSSPHTWGILQRVRSGLNIVRFIPTYVGHTECSEVRFFVHIGSSPHTWGIHRVLALGLGKNRFIPTYVGHTIKEKTEE